jgi:hypothetical protein
MKPQALLSREIVGKKHTILQSVVGSRSLDVGDKHLRSKEPRLEKRGKAELGGIRL